MAVDVDRATFAMIDVCGDFDRAIREVQTPQEALKLSLLIREGMRLLQTSDLMALLRADDLCGLKRRA